MIEAFIRNYRNIFLSQSKKYGIFQTKTLVCADGTNCYNSMILSYYEF